MVILREENNSIVMEIVNIANTIMRKTNLDIVDTKLTMQRIEMVSTAIMDNEYKKQYMLLKDNHIPIKGFIKPRANSWINLISKKVDNEFDTFNISKYDSDVITNISTRLGNEIILYKNKYGSMVKQYSNKLDTMTETLSKTPLVENSFNISLVKEIDLFDILQEKNWLNIPMVDIPANIVKPEILNTNVLDIKNDLEIKVLAEEAFKNLNDDTLLKVATILNAENINSYKEQLWALMVKDINIALGVVLVIRDTMLSLDMNSIEYIGYTELLKHAVNTYKKLHNLYIPTEKRGTVVIHTAKTDKDITIYCLEDNFNKYINDPSGSLKTIIGGIFKTVNIFEMPIGGNTVLMLTHDELIIDKAEFDRLRESVQNAYILKNKNETAGTLRTYYLLALEEIVGTDISKYRSKTEEYLNTLTLGELYDTYQTPMEIIEHIVSEGTNFKVFSEAMREAKEILNKEEPSVLAGYASLKLILNYLIGQTEII